MKIKIHILENPPPIPLFEDSQQEPFNKNKEIIFIAGKSGAGKSMFLQNIQEEILKKQQIKIQKENKRQKKKILKEMEPKFLNTDELPKPKKKML